MSSHLDLTAEDICIQDPEFMDQSPRRKAIALAEYLRQRDLLGLQSDVSYHDLKNNFIGIALQGEEHPSLPLISVVIYCCVARRLGMDAHPCGFPFHVFAIIKPPPGRNNSGHNAPDGTTQQPMYMDPFRSSQEVYVQNLKDQLQAMAIPLSHHVALLDASSTSEIVQRSAKNIIKSVQHFPRNHGGGGPLFPDTESAFYASLWALILLPDGNPSTSGGQRARHLSFLAEHLEKHFLMDAWLLEDHVLPLIRNPTQSRQLLENVRVIRSSDRMPKEVKGRTAAALNSVRYKVGHVFQHKRYHYQAVITGWDAECCAGEEWMAQMGVHDLSRGKHQSFYYVLCVVFSTHSNS